MKVKRLSEKMKMGIIDTLSNLLKKRDEIIFSYLHGSFIENSYFRDIDVAIFVNENHLLKNDILEYELSLSSELQSKLGNYLEHS
jgi:predicted nucleotidyltransferase